MKSKNFTPEKLQKISSSKNIFYSRVDYYELNYIKKGAVSAPFFISAF